MPKEGQPEYSEWSEDLGTLRAIIEEGSVDASDLAATIGADSDRDDNSGYESHESSYDSFEAKHPLLPEPWLRKLFNQEFVLKDFGHELVPLFNANGRKVFWRHGLSRPTHMATMLQFMDFSSRTVG